MYFDSTKTLFRRFGIVKYLDEHKMVHYVELQYEFEVGATVIADDLEFIENVLDVPLERFRGRYGGVSIMEGWKSGKLLRKEVKLLLKLYPKLDTSEDEITMKALLIRLAGVEMLFDIHAVIDEKNI
jgi:hypothetical protein